MDRPYESYFKIMPLLKSRFSEAAGCYASMRDRIGLSVTRAEWAFHPRHAMEPLGLWFLGHPQPGRLIKSEPKLKKGKVRHGYDARDRLVLTESYSKIEGGFDETFLEYFDDRVESTNYSRGLYKVCMRVETLLIEAGLPTALLRYSPGGESVVVYEYDRGRIAHYWNASTDPWVAGRLNVHRGVVIYEAETVERIELEWEGGEGKLAILNDGRECSLPLPDETNPVQGLSAISTFAPRSAKKQFLLTLEKAGHQLATLTAEQGVAVMLDFYLEQRANGCSLAEDGDMLLFQWGILTAGKRELFYIDITRQLTITEVGADGTMRQLSLSFQFPAEEGLRSLPESNRWCMTPDGLSAFRAFIHDFAAWKEVASVKPMKVALSFGEV